MNTLIYIATYGDGANIVIYVGTDEFDANGIMHTQIAYGMTQCKIEEWSDGKQVSSRVREFR